VSLPARLTYILLPRCAASAHLLLAFCICVYSLCLSYPQPCFLLAADRFKALQKRGLVEPRKPSGRKVGRKVEYVTGTALGAMTSTLIRHYQCNVSRTRQAKAQARHVQLAVQVLALRGHTGAGHWVGLMAACLAPGQTAVTFHVHSDLK
jgi:hypothetical protein